MSDAFQRELEVVARFLVANPRALRAVKQKEDAGIGYIFEDMKTNQPVGLVNVIQYMFPLTKHDLVPVRVSSVKEAIRTSIKHAMLPVSILCLWEDEHWGLVNIPAEFEQQWETRKHAKTNEEMFIIPLKDFSILMNYANKSNTKIDIVKKYSVHKN